MVAGRREPAYQLGFAPRTTDQPTVVVTDTGCYGATVATRGIPQPALLDKSNALEAAAVRMLGITGY
jgi:hypothetical protein